jgi:hypothetical protein
VLGKDSNYIPFSKKIRSKRLGHFQPTIFPLFIPIFLFLKKKQKGFPLQSGLGDKGIGGK